MWEEPLRVSLTHDMTDILFSSTAIQSKTLLAQVSRVSDLPSNDLRFKNVWSQQVMNQKEQLCNLYLGGAVCFLRIPVLWFVIVALCDAPNCLSCPRRRNVLVMSPMRVGCLWSSLAMQGEYGRIWENMASVVDYRHSKFESWSCLNRLNINMHIYVDLHACVCV